MALTKNQIRDHKKYFVERGQEGFNPKWNKMVVNEVIAEAEAMKKRREKTFENKIRERASAVASYLKSGMINSGRPIERYLGKKNLAYLQGQKIVEVIKGKSKQLLEVNN